MPSKLACGNTTTSISPPSIGAELLLMLYDGCLKFLRQERLGSKQKTSKFAKFLSKSQAII